jgi:dienelactone hydrolase
MTQFAIGPIQDRRFTEIRHLDMVYEFNAPESKQAWEERAAYLREQILTGAGLIPMPERCLLNAKVFGLLDRGDYTIEKVYFESLPGFYVTGNLYRPKDKIGPFPAILNPHGHWPRGRLENGDMGTIPGRCANLAMQGYIAFAYDMVGYNDSTHFNHREDLLRPLDHLWALSMGGLQLWDSIRAVDFLMTLPDVDKNRICCTGSSGGGTQTFLLAAVDDRVKYVAPVCMISSTMQGGCPCENPPLIRLDTNNMEIGALAAPRPMLMISATGDWTKTTRKVEFPAVGNVYKLYGAEYRVTNNHFRAPHNYNKGSREAMYAWFGRLFGVINTREQPWSAETDQDMLVFTHEPRPANALDGEKLIESRVQAAKDQIESFRPHDAESLEAFRKAYGPALMHSLAGEFPMDVQAEDRGSADFEGFAVKKLVIGSTIPALLFTPKSPMGATLLVHPDGKEALLNGSLLKQLRACGQAVFAIDCFNTGEHVGPAESADRLTRYKFFDTYNRTDTANRVQDILTSLAYLESTNKTVNLVGIGDAGLWCMLARAFAPKVNKTVIDASGFDTSNDQAFVERLYVPCLRRAGDFRTAGSLIAPGKTMIHNTRGRFKTDWVEDAYKAAGKSSSLAVQASPASDESIADWLK